LQLLEDLLLVLFTAFSPLSSFTVRKIKITDEATGYNQEIIPLAFTMKQCSDQFPQLSIPFWYDFVLAISQLGGFLGALIVG
jgi:hypothetical protein